MEIIAIFVGFVSLMGLFYSLFKIADLLVARYLANKVIKQSNNKYSNCSENKDCTRLANCGVSSTNIANFIQSPCNTDNKNHEYNEPIPQVAFSRFSHITHIIKRIKTLCQPNANKTKGLQGRGWSC